MDDAGDWQAPVVQIGLAQFSDQLPQTLGIDFGDLVWRNIEYWMMRHALSNSDVGIAKTAF